MIKLETGFQNNAISSQSSQQQIAQAKSMKLKGDASEKEVEKAASGFEALLLHNMIKEMWKTSGGGDGLLGENSNESQIFRDMFNQAIADEISIGEGIGVKDFLKKELSKSSQGASKKV